MGIDANKIIEDVVKFFKEQNVTYPKFDPKEKKIKNIEIDSNLIKAYLSPESIADAVSSLSEAVGFKLKELKREEEVLLIVYALYGEAIDETINRLSNINQTIDALDEEEDIDYTFEKRVLQNVVADWLREGTQKDINNMIKKLKWGKDITENLCNVARDVFFDLEINEIFSNLGYGSITDYIDLIVDELKARSSESDNQRGEMIGKINNEIKEFNDKYEQIAKAEIKALEDELRKDDNKKDKQLGYIG
ncbi:MAG: hypothetical protein ACP5HW_00180 [Candidatus Micrarchaeia archaeon]